MGAVEKRCSKCSAVQPLSAFNMQKASRDGHSPWCRSCQSAYNKARKDRANAIRRARYQLFPEVRERVLNANARRATANPEYTSQRHREYRLRDVEAAKARSRDRYWSDPDRSRAEARSRYYANKDAFIERNRKRKVRLAGNGVFVVTDRDIARLFMRCDGRCSACGSTDHLHLDHIIPVARGGRHSIGNLTILCRRCNAAKKHRTMTEWRHGRSPSAA